MGAQLSLCATIVCGGLCFWSLLHWLSGRRAPGQPHPPGPTGYPFVGYVKAIPNPLWKTYLGWSHQYGSAIVRINVLGNNIIVANTLNTAIDLLDKRSSIYSDRPVDNLVMANDLVGFDWSTAGVSYGHYWRESRKFFHQTFSPSAVRRYRPVELAATHKLLCRLLKSPKDFKEHVRYQVGSVIIRSSYGIEVLEKGDPYIAAAEHGLWIANRCMEPGAWLVDLVPFLKHVPAWLPGAGFKRQANMWRKEIAALVSNPFEEIKKKQQALPYDCAARVMFNSISDDSTNVEYVENVVIKGTLATMYAAGSDTTTSALETFFLAMTLYPDIQLEARKEIDRVCEGRLPDFSEYDALPYIHAIVKECLRWRPALPLAVPHMNTRDDVYEGYTIPKGSIVFPNIRAILHDPQTYVDPEVFKPSRFLQTQGTNSGASLALDPTVLDPATVTFGFGRRACPGRWMVYESMWIAIASVLAVFEISPTLDDQGQPVMPESNYTNSFISYPEDFLCNIKARSSEHEKLITALHNEFS